MSTNDAHDLIRRSRHYLGQAALNMLIYPEDLGKIDRNIERAVEFAMQFRRTFDNSVMPDEWKRLTDEGRTIKLQRAQIDSSVAHATAPLESIPPETLAQNPAATQEPEDEPEPTAVAEAADPLASADSALLWEPTSDNMGSIAQHGDTVYTVHTIGNPRAWAWGIGDGYQTTWQEARFPTEELARDAAEHHCHQSLQEPTT